MLSISNPTLLVDEHICKRNIRRMAEKARKSNVVFRPHFKTHQSAYIADWFREEGVERITVSSVQMASYFAKNGWTDITIAFPYNPLESSKIEKLASEINLGILIESTDALTHAAKHIGAPLSYWIKIDVGTGRTGIAKSDFEKLSALAQSPNTQHQLAGVLTHAGHTYRKINRSLAQDIYNESLRLLKKALSFLPDSTLISYGDTPSCSLIEDFSELDEIRPGNFIFYDWMQLDFGSCQLENIAVCLACPVVATHPERNEAVIYGGAVHLSKDAIEEKTLKYGAVVKLEKDHWSKEIVGGVVRLSQEHGIISGSQDFISSLQIGDIIGVLPIHSCLTADLQGSYLSLAGNTISKLYK